MMNHLRRWPFYPLIFSVVTVINFFFTNSKDSTLNGIFFTLIVATLVLFIIWSINYLLTRNFLKSSLLAFTTAILVFSFQNLIGIFRLWSVTKSSIISLKFWYQNQGQWLAFLLILFLMGLIFVLVKRVKRIPQSVILYLNIFSFLFLILSLTQGIITTNKNNDLRIKFLSYWGGKKGPIPQNVSTEIDQMPDIYYIILDGFGRSDTFSRLYGFDNNDFINELSSRGFYVAEYSYANYTQTRTSLASSLNMMYLDEPASVLREKPTYFFPAYLMVGDSIVENTLDSLGYEKVSFPSEISYSNFQDWDIYNHPKGFLSNYSRTYLSSTAFSVVLNSLLYSWHEETIDFTLNNIPLTGGRESPQFIFAHILCPHPPFIFGNDGITLKNRQLYSIADASHLLLLKTNKEYEIGYKKQVEYIQTRIIKMVDEIKVNSDRPFIIILQGDHGPGLLFDHDSLDHSDISERLGILNAYYFYNEDYDSLYPQISPVNSFRLIFKQYLGIDLSLLRDSHYYSTYNELFKFSNVDELLP